MQRMAIAQLQKTVCRALLSNIIQGVSIQGKK